MKALSNKFSVIEYFVIAIVIFTATSLYFNDSNLEHKDMELISLTGNIELSTRESMDAFGLQDFTTNARASLNLSVNSLQEIECKTCPTSTVGTILHGDIIITELYDSENRRGRVEGKLNFTHLYASVETNYIIKEQINFHWVAGDIESSWQLTLNHDPPRWLPKYDISTLFIETELGLETRSGPELLITEPNSEQRIIHACLPESFLCKSTSPDALLVANYGIRNESTQIPEMLEWQIQNTSVYTSANTTEILASEVVSAENLIPNDIGYTPPFEVALLNVSTYVLDNQLNTIAPLSAWFNAVDLIPIQLDLFGDSVVHLRANSSNIYNVIGPTGLLKVGLVIY